MGRFTPTLTQLRRYWLGVRFSLVSLLRWRRLRTPATTLVFADEFTALPDPAVWMDRYYWGRALPSNRELQWYTPGTANLVRVGESVVALETRKIPTRGIGPEGEPLTFPFSSALLSTGGSFRFRYGRVQVRCRFPHPPYTRAAIWLLSENVLPEIDLAETDGNAPHYVSCTFHSGTAYQGPGEAHTASRLFSFRSLLNDFHVWELEWTPTALRWYVDGWLVKEVFEHVPQGPAYLLLNTAVSNDEAHGDRINPAHYPARFELDWVRIYAPEAS